MERVDDCVHLVCAVTARVLERRVQLIQRLKRYDTRIALYHLLSLQLIEKKKKKKNKFTSLDFVSLIITTFAAFATKVG